MLTVILLYPTIRQESWVRVTRQEDGATWEFMPFESRAARFVAAVVGDRVLVADDTGVVALFDPETDTCLRQTSLGRRCRKIQGLIRHEGRQALLYTETALFLLDCETLAVLAAFNGMRPRPSGQDFDLVAEMPGDEVQPIQIDSPNRRFTHSEAVSPGLIAHSDGILIASSTIPPGVPGEKPEGPVSYGLMTFDLERQIATRQVAQSESSNVFQNGFNWFSPSGRLAVRLHYAAIPRHDGRSSWRYADIFGRLLGKDARPELPDCKLDRVERVGTAVEVWQTWPLKPVAKLVLQMQPLDTVLRPDDREDIQALARMTDFASKHPGDSFPFKLGGPMTPAVTPWRNWQQSSLIDLAWEEDESGFWILLERSQLRRVGLDGSVSPLFALRQLRLLAKNTDGGLRGDARDRQHVLRVLGNGRIRINYIGDRIVRVPLSGTAVGGEEIFIEEEESHIPGTPLDLPITKAVSERLGRHLRTFIALPDLTQDGIIGAIQTLTDRVDTDLSGMLWRAGYHYLRVIFMTPSHMIEERDFFELAAKLDPAVIIPSLRRLLLTFCKAEQKEKSRKTGIVHSDYYGALGHALLALVRLDANCTDVVTAYLASRNVDNNPFIREELLLAYHDRFKWQGEPGIRLAVLFAAYEEFHAGAGIRYVWKDYRLREAAREISPGAFADLICSERAPLGWKTDLREVVAAWAAILTDEPFEEAVKSLLMARLQSDETDAIARIRDALLHIKTKADSTGWIIHMVRSLELDRIGRANLSARDFGALIVEATQGQAGTDGFDERYAARIIRILRAIAEVFDRNDLYGAEVIEVLNKACNDAMARVPSGSKAGWLVTRLLQTLRYGYPERDSQVERRRCLEVIAELCATLDASSPYAARVIQYLQEAAREYDPPSWRGYDRE